MANAIGIILGKHGETREEEYNGWSSFFGIIIHLLLLLVTGALTTLVEAGW